MKNILFKFLSILSLMCIFNTYSTHAQWLENDKVVASNRMADDNFGSDIKTNGDFMVVGSPQHDTAGLSDSGAAYVYQRTGSSWTQIQILSASDATANDLFGYSVSISEFGDQIVIGAPGQDTDENGQAFMSNSGAAYIFERSGLNSWAQVKKIVAVDKLGTSFRQIGTNFGNDVDVSSEKIIVGARFESNLSAEPNIINSGAAYIFHRLSTSGGSWFMQKRLLASDGKANDSFGWSVAIHSLKAVVGAPKNDYDSSGGNFISNSGAAYVFETFLSGADWWLETAKLTSSDRSANDLFGFSVDILDTIIVGAPNDDEGTFGQPLMSNAGSAFTFKRDNLTGTWPLDKKLVANDRSADNYFGVSVGKTKSYAVVGAPDNETDAGGHNPLTGAGAAYIYKRVFIFGYHIWAFEQKIVSSDREVDDHFGYSVDIDIYGGQCTAGAHYEDHNGNSQPGSYLSDAGSAYIFELDTGEPEATKPLETVDMELKNTNLIIFPVNNKVYEVNYRTTMKFESMSIRVLNMLGQEIISGEMQSEAGSYRANLDLNTASNGVYFVELSNENHKVTKRFLVK